METRVERERPHRQRQRMGIVVLAWLAAAGPLAGCATAAARPGADAVAAERRVHEEACGIRVEALRVSAAGYMLDFRYRVTDPSKAAPLLDGRQKPYLTDAKGAKLGVPDTPVLGSLRQTARNGKVAPDHTYFILFANPAKYLHPGDRVTLVVGDARLPGLTVQ
jgi:hypothetical protein